MNGPFGKPCLLAHIHLDRGRFASSFGFYSWVLDTVLDAWYATTLDTEDILSGANE